MNSWRKTRMQRLGQQITKLAGLHIRSIDHKTGGFSGL
jgi:hypothetical protein